MSSLILSASKRSIDLPDRSRSNKSEKKLMEQLRGCMPFQ